MRQKLLSLLFWVGSAIITFILFLAMSACTVILYPFDRMRRVAHRQCYWWSDMVIAMNPYWKVKAKGLENIDKARAYVIVANHQSLADIAVIYQARMQFKWVAKEELFGIPVLGWCMRLGRHIKLERGNFGSIKQVYREAATWLRSGMSVLFFPEGTRSEGNRVGEFQNGAFKLAIKEKAPILPMSVKGTGQAIPKGSWIFNEKVDGSVTVLPAVETSGYKSGDFAALRDAVRSAIESA